jgi:hypothetical protein
MILDNIDSIKRLLVFPEGVFYFIQVIQRKKENPDLPKSDMKRYQCFITSEEDLEIHIPRIKKVCEDFNARAYISLLPRSLEKLGKCCLLEYAKRVNSGDYSRIWDIPNRLALLEETRMPKIINKPLRLLDIDDINSLDYISDFVKEIGLTIVEIIPTMHGYHLLVEAFNPAILERGGAIKRGEDYVLPDGKSRFTYREESNTILYAVNTKSL